MSEDNKTSVSTSNETFQNIMDRRLMMFTMDCINQEIKIKLKNSNKIYSGTLQAFNPFNFSIIVQNFIGSDDKAEYKIISLQ